MSAPRPARPAPLVGAVAAALVIAALAAVASAVGDPVQRAAPGPPGLPGRALLLALDALTGATIVLVAGAVVALLWALLTGPRGQPEARRPWWHTLVVIAVFAAAAGILMWQLEHGWLADLIEQRAADAWPMAPPDTTPDLGPLGAREAVDPALRSAAAVSGALLVAVAAGAWWWLARRRRLRGGTSHGAPPAPLAAAVEASIEDLDAVADPREAILRCYARLDAAIAAAGCARRPAETAREHRLRAAEALGPAAEAAARLVDRFERARYGDAAVTEQDRSDAVAALDEVRHLLAAGQGSPT